MRNSNVNSSAYSTEDISPELMEEIAEALKSISPFGSVEIYVQNSRVTQMTIRHIRKTASDSS